MRVRRRRPSRSLWDRIATPSCRAAGPVWSPERKRNPVLQAWFRGSHVGKVKVNALRENGDQVEFVTCAGKGGKTKWARSRKTNPDTPWQALMTIRL